VTLTGPGGIGKTRLAAAVGEHVDGPVVFVALASLGDPALVLPHIAAELGIPLEGARPPLDVLVEQLGDAPLLLVLDNLEQVVAVGPRLDALLARCPGLRILATSRTVLRLRAEREYPVPQLASEEAVALFVDRARAVRPDFELDEASAPAVAEICGLLDGLPLAIELAAARIRLLDPDALLARLRTSFDALGAGPVDLPERQRTLRAAVEWSIGLLSPDEREMLATLSVFVDGWTLDAALALDDRALDLLDALAGHSLVSVHGARFRMLGAVREVAAGLRTDPDADHDADHEVERRHAGYYRDLAARADWATVGSTESADMLRPEEGNLRAAVRWFMAHDIGPLPAMFRAFWMLWWRYDQVAEGRAWIEELLPRAGELDDRARTELALMAAVTAVEVGDDEGALAGIAQLDLAVDDPHLASLAQLARSWALPIAGDYDGALVAVHAALDGLRPLGDVFMTEGALNTLAMLEIACGRDDAAADALAEAVELSDRHGASWNTPITVVLRAGLAVRRGDRDEARDLLRTAVSGEVDLSTQATTLGLVVLAEVALLDGDLSQAARALGAADGARRRTGLRVWTTERSSDAELLAKVRGQLDPQAFAAAHAAGSALSRREAVALLRD
jgi:predicted ATPase